VTGRAGAASRRPPRLLLELPLLLVLLPACRRPPIVEEMTLRFDGRGGVVAVIRTRLDPSPGGEAAKRAVAAYRERMDRGDDPWRRSIDAAAPELERTTLERRKGELVEVTRELTLSGPEAVAGLFGDDAVRAGVTVDGDRIELTLVPAGSRAEPGDQPRLGRAHDELVRLARAYLEATGSLYRWLESHPERREEVLGHLFAELLGEDDQARLEARYGGDEGQDEALLALVEAHEESGDQLLDLLFDDQGGNEPLEVASRRALAPLRAELRVQVEGEVVEVEGFEPAGGGAGGYAVPELSLLAAVAVAARSVAEPLPAETLVRHEASGEEPWPLERVLALRPVAGPVPADLAVRIDRALEPAGAYRLVWRLPDAGGR
jgi:hypothetical protein